MSLVQHFAYRALKPFQYDPESLPSYDARIEALRFPIMRLVGPLWSFGLTAASLDALPEADLPDEALHALSLMQEQRAQLGQTEAAGNPVQHQLPTLHRPHVMRVSVDRFFSYDSAPQGGAYFTDPGEKYYAATRLSIIGVHTLAGEHQGMDKDTLLDHTPVETGQAPEGATTGLTVATLTRMPETRTADQDTVYLPACQLLTGRIGFRPRPLYLQMLRARLALDAAGGFDPTGPQGLVYLLPDGFALFGAVEVPWRDQPISGWFKVSRTAPGDADTPAQVTVWTETPHPEEMLAGTERWPAAVDTLNTILFSGEKTPGWLSLDADRPIDPEDFFWPMTPEPAPYHSLVRRVPPNGARIFLDERAIAARLAARYKQDAPTSVLTLKPERYELRRDGNSLVLTSPDAESRAEAMVSEADALHARYEYLVETQAAESPEEDTETVTETLTLNSGAAVELAVPLVQTAEDIRGAMGLPAPEGARPGLIWTFVPVAAGWLHMPLPNATLNSLNGLKAPTPEPASAPQQVSPRTARRTTGALGFQNRPDAPGFRENNRTWSFSLAHIEEGAMVITFDMDKNRVAAAEITLGGGQIALDGAVPTVPYRQSPERLLPDHAERALANRGFLAVSPDMLRDLEADVWALEINGAPALRINLDVAGLAFSAQYDGTVGVLGDVSIVTHMHSDALDVSDAARAPWLWCRQSNIPSVQNLPLGLAGAARNAPSGSRELAPLRHVGADQLRMAYRFKGALDMTKGAPCFITEGTWMRPTNRLSWMDEVGMSHLGLPSITFFPGLSDDLDNPNLDRLPADDLSWSEGLSTTLLYEARHDLSVSDETFTSASLPKRRPDQDRADPEEPSVAEMPQSRLFVPRADNGPDAPMDASLETSVWHTVWTGLQRDLALSASEQRAMLVRRRPDPLEPPEIHLDGVFGYRSAKSVPVIDGLTKITTDKEDASHSYHGGGGIEPKELISLGAWQVNTGWGPSLPLVAPFTGLPSESDLVGINGSTRLTLDDRYNSLFNFGTLRAEISPRQSLHDQRGFEAHVAQYGPTFISRPLTIWSYDTVTGQRKDNVSAVTARKPLKEAANGKLRFWFADVPIKDDALHPGSNLVDSGDDWSRHKINASSYANTPLQGFRWWLSDGGAPRDDGAIVAAGLHFTPLALSAFEMSGDTLSEVQILGRPALRLDDGGAEPPGTSGEALLILKFSGTQFTATYQSLEDCELRWPLADAARFDGVVPTLVMSKWPTETADEPTPAKIEAALDGLAFEVSVGVWFDTDNILRMKVSDGGPGTDQVFYPTKIKAAMTTDSEDALALLEADGLSLDLDAELSAGTDWCLAARVRVSLSEPDLPVLKASGHLTSVLSAGARRVAAESVDDVPLASLGQRGFHMEWRTDGATPPLADAIAVEDLKGILSVALVPVPGRKLRLKAQDVDLEAQAVLRIHAARGKVAGQTVKLQRRHGDAAFRLYGVLDLPNLYRWPDVTMSAAPNDGWANMTLLRGAAPSVAHTCRVRFDGQPFHGLSSNNEIVVAAPVDHTLTWQDPVSKPAMTWTAMQVLRMTTIRALKTALEKDRDQADNLQADLSTFAVSNPDALSLTSEQAKRLFYRNLAAHHASLTGHLRTTWLSDTADLDGLVVDLSSHHQLDWQGGNTGTGPDWLVLPLPHISVLTQPKDPDEQVWVPTGNLDAALSSQLEGDLDLWVHSFDLPGPGTLARPEETVLNAARERLSRDLSNQPASDVPALALGMPEILTGNLSPQVAQTRSVFQSTAIVKTGSGARLLAVTHPALYHALFLGVLKAQGLVKTPQAYAYAAGGPSSEAVPEDIDNDMVSTLARYARRLAAHLVSVPRRTDADDAPLPDAVKRGHLLIARAASRDGSRLRELARRFSVVRDGDAPAEQRDLQWAMQTLQRLAPWAKAGTLTRESAQNNAATGYLLPRPKLRKIAIERDSRPTRAARPPRLMPAQPQRMAPPANPDTALPDRLAAGFTSSRSDAALWASENAVKATTYSDGPRLTATAAEATWHLDGSASAYLGTPASDAAFVLQDRSHVSFREAKAWSDSTGPQRLTAALPDDYHAAFPAALHPQPGLPEGVLPTYPLTTQPVVPGRMLTARLSPRAGVWSTAWLGLGTAGMVASERPLNQRNPRPPLLAVNDRPRASSHEVGHVSVCPDPTIIIHGPRASRTDPGALSRAPRSAWATIATLTSPQQGLIDGGWDGAIRFAGTPSTGITNWQVSRASAVLNGERFVVEPKAEQTLDQPITGLIDRQAGRDLRTAAMSASPATPVEVAIDLRHTSADGFRLERRVRLVLLTKGTGLGLTEAPVYLRFDDPEYNDRLNGRAMTKMGDVQSMQSVKASEIIFASDLRKVRPNDRLELALGLRYGNLLEGAGNRHFFQPLGVGGTPSMQSNPVQLANFPVNLTVERLRPATGEAEAKPLLLSTKSWQIGATPTPTLALSLALDEDLRIEAGGPNVDLQAKDQLRLTAKRGDKVIAELKLEVVVDAQLPGNPSAFAALQMSGDGPDAEDTDLAVGAPLYANSPPASVLELVDPRDLLDGFVRRRAIYQWRSFVSRDAFLRHGLYKQAGSGAAWIEPDLGEGWVSTGKPPPHDDNDGAS